MYEEIFPSRIKYARNNTGFTQREVAKETGIAQPNIARYEKGTLQPDIEKLGILADFYGVSVDWLIGTAGWRDKETPQYEPSKRKNTIEEITKIQCGQINPPPKR